MPTPDEPIAQETQLSTEQRRLVSMLDYLEQWDKLNRSAVLDVHEHQGGFLAWQSDLEGMPGVQLNVPDAGGDVWLRIDRLRPQNPPPATGELSAWVVVPDDPEKVPTHRESMHTPRTSDRPTIFAETPSLVQAFKEYLEGPWHQWAVVERPRRASIARYDKLFNLLQTVETEGAGTAIELVWGMGVAVWRKDGRQVRYPLISRLVEIDPISPDMALRIRPRGMGPILETDPYVTLENPGVPVFERAARAILDHPDSDVQPFAEASYEQILCGAAGTLDRQARYWPREAEYVSGKLPPISDVLTVTNVWVLFARRKGTSFLIEDVRRLREEVVRKPVPPGAPKVLVETPVGAAPDRVGRSWRGVSSPGFSGSGAGQLDSKVKDRPTSELYFPKPFNAEQVQIIDRLENSDGVVVQGPPGTGKTHTIANIICHYLAEGKRVLVTSKGESALSVLREQLPSPVQSLTVSLLTSEREGLQQLEQNVSKITAEVTSLNKAEYTRSIDATRRTIDALHSRIGATDRELAEWARKNIDPVPSALDGLRPEALASHVGEGQAKYAWFPDRLDGRPEHEITFSSDAVARLRDARRNVGADLNYLRTNMPSAEGLPSAPQMGDLHRSLLDLQSVSGELDEKKAPEFVGSTPMHLESAERLRLALLDGARTRRSFSTPWIGWLRNQLEAGKAAHPVLSVVIQISEEFAGLTDTRRALFGVAIEWSDEWDSDEDLFLAIRNSSAGLNPFGLLPFGKKVARERYKRVRVNGSPAKQATDWGQVEIYVTLRRQTAILIHRWNSLASECPIPSLPLDPNLALRAFEEILEHIRQVREWVTEIVPSLVSQIASLLKHKPWAEHFADDPAELERLAEAIEIRLKRHRLESARQELEKLRRTFRTADCPLFVMVKTFLESKLGNIEHETFSIEREWQSFLVEMDRVRALKDDFATIKEVCARIEAAGAKRWAAALASEPSTEAGCEWIPSDWADAWKWSRQFGYLLAIDGRERIQALAADRLQMQGDLAAAYARLVEQLTWLKLRETLDEDRGLLAALQQYLAAIRGIGAGTGVRAVRYRQDARRAMQRANRAIRCWIMPHWRVSESLPSELAIFDLVIIDEASQSDLWALPALLRAKKLLIVGDNKQVSPSAIGVRDQDIVQLHSRFLRDLPFGDVLSPEKSIYDLGSVMFATDLVRLREHFRCVEPIIEFSNQLCQYEMRCLRVAKASERIVPPLVDVFVRNGARDARSAKTNRAEARAIVQEISALTRDPQFASRSIGVVSLLGSEQPRLIFDMLIAELGEEKIVSHHIRCGDAMTFQGREADIIFISMVADGESVRAMTGQTYEQRFNVAASRARDRMYLYRSFKREDLSENDLRARLLDHFAAPLRRIPEKRGRDRCESNFERAVYDRLHEGGFRVNTQVPVAGYRIDIVVEGHGGRRLAVECDGDQYHTSEVWLQDLQRQRTLERAGWTFWRCWGSSFLRDPDACMQSLFQSLERQGIDPVGPGEIDLRDVVVYREVGDVLQEDQAVLSGTDSSSVEPSPES